MKSAWILLLGSWLRILLHLYVKHLNLAFYMTRLAFSSIFIFVLNTLLSLRFLGDHGHDFVVKLILSGHWRT